MRRFQRPLILGLAILAGTFALVQQPTGAQAPGVTVSGLAPIGSILEIMQEIVDPMAVRSGSRCRW